MEKEIDEFYDIICNEILNYFLLPNEKNKYLSYKRIKIFISDLIDFLNSESFYIFTNYRESKDKEEIFFKPKLFSFTLLPQKLNKEILELCRECTLLYSEIFDSMICDMQFLLKTFENTKEYDEFYKSIIDICERVYLNKENGRDIKNDIRCVIGRSDYMTNKKDNQKEDDIEIKQVEYNTIAVAFGNLSSILFKAHKNIIKEIYREYFPYFNEKNEKEINDILEKKFQNNFTEGIITCFIECHNAYISNFKPLQGKYKTIIISVSVGDDLNKFDKYKTKNELKKFGIDQMFFTLKELQVLFEKKKLFLNYRHETLRDSLNRIKKNSNDYEQFKPGKLFLNLNDDDANFLNETNYERNIYEISVIYFRSLYSPYHFNETIWSLREMIEFSDSVKIPSLPYQLVGSKRIQMLLLDDDILKKYISYDLNKNKKTEQQIINDMNTLKKSFALQVDPSLDKNSHIISLAIENEKNFLLKPQREGGMNNLHGSDVKEKLMLYYDEKEKHKLSIYVLMQKLFPSSFITVHCRTKKKENEDNDHSYFIEFSPEKSISEISLFHNFIFYKNKNILNEQKGYLIRTKNINENEGGAICGISSLDSFFLI
ncbi:glutathione synthetase, putative [Plasmodium gallinaceum]|uniref:Glutathione synthetase n=1 Tax=Plasmodium gallinaceum TaxID=5849 RepID=A0A1J1GZM4_PLAGA|nr:glutathione synthetase, putative [Plasmodium gallinaceum]CRG97898.1 glutathione synthetase, putative [Plasmodium gallinaceum]